jgi:hypothetical protein
MTHRSKAKGYRGEVEILELIQAVVNKVCTSKGMSPFELSRSPHGRDIVGIPWLSPEVKRVENDIPYLIDAWWSQAKVQAIDNKEPVLFYRRNSRPWQVRLFGNLPLPGGARVRCPVDVSMEAFLTWLELRLRQ